MTFQELITRRDGAITAERMAQERLDDAIRVYQEIRQQPNPTPQVDQLAPLAREHVHLESQIAALQEKIGQSYSTASSYTGRIQKIEDFLEGLSP